MAVGFDFGTTNTLISFIAGDRAISVLDEEGLPFPSVVRYEGEKVIAGREAKEALDAAGLGVQGNTVRSPKFLLGEESVHVGGVERSPIDIVHDVVRYAKAEAMRSVQAKSLGDLSSAVVTIPITMNGPRRAALRDAFRRSDIGIVQFVHEPLAALYGYVRSQRDAAEARRALNRRNVLVVDWGGGTLDLTLCRVDGGRVTQLRNGGSDVIGGDRFDEAIRDEVVSRFVAKTGLPVDAEVHRDAMLRLLHRTEENKIELSNRPEVSFYLPDFFRSPQVTLDYPITREELDEITRPLVTAGMRQIEALLDSVNVGPSQVSLCLVAGGMASMPAIRSRLYELFGSQRVEIPDNSATLVSEGAAWIAHDAQRLRLSKPIELQLARGSYLPLVRAGTEMPSEGEVKSKLIHLFCVDPSDGFAKFQLCSPMRPTTHPQVSEPRSSVGELVVQVDQRARPFHERLELEVSIDDDLILRAIGTSSDVQDRDVAAFHDLEFALDLPDTVDGKGSDRLPDSTETTRTEPGGLAVRSNITAEKDYAVVPGEVLHRHDRQLFDRRSKDPRRATDVQVREYLYYQPCSVCGRRSSDPNCRCGSTAAAE